ncbi:hypothetical protein B0H16DRAFT_1731542 [Mycena metata]|uniref:Uncharacterized protein n=1 Tax=Mycena metata TaxID=1033252 RepID=A0AAD7I4N4_9AGAR|nr:hypothetical protein B0H16DRAFT_1731542 [Mycena metata]
MTHSSTVNLYFHEPARPRIHIRGSYPDRGVRCGLPPHIQVSASCAQPAFLTTTVIRLGIGTVAHLTSLGPAFVPHPACIQRKELDEATSTPRERRGWPSKRIRERRRQERTARTPLPLPSLDPFVLQPHRPCRGLHKDTLLVLPIHLLQRTPRDGSAGGSGDAYPPVLALCTRGGMVAEAVMRGGVVLLGYEGNTAVRGGDGAVMLIVLDLTDSVMVAIVAEGVRGEEAALLAHVEGARRFGVLLVRNLIEGVAVVVAGVVEGF